MAGCGKTYTVGVLVAMFLKSRPGGRVILTAWTAPATVNLRRAVGCEDDPRVLANTVMGLTCAGSTASAASSRDVLVVVDEYCQLASAELERLRRKYAGCTMYYTGDADQVGVGTFPGDREVPPWWPSAPFCKMVRQDAAVGAGRRRANYTQLTRQERISAADESTRALSAAVSAISQCEAGGWAALGDVAEGIAARSTSDAPVGPVAVDSKLQSVLQNNGHTRRCARAGDRVVRLVQPLRTGGRAGELAAYEFLVGGRARVDANQSNSEWRAEAQRRERGEAADMSVGVYDVHNYENVYLQHVTPRADAPLPVGAAGISANAPTGISAGGPTGGPAVLGLPPVPMPAGVAVSVVHVGPDTVAEVTTAGGATVEMVALAVPGAPGGFAHLALMPYPTDAITDVPAKFQGFTLASLTVSIALRRVLREHLYMLLTRCKECGSLRFWPRPAPGQLTQIFVASSARDRHRDAFKRDVLRMG